MALPFEGDTEFGRNETYDLTQVTESILTTYVKERPSTSRDDDAEDSLSDVSDDHEPKGCWQRTKDSFKSFFLMMCPTCLTNLPSLVLILMAVLLVLFVIVSIPLVFALTYSQPASLAGNDISERDYANTWPSYDDIETRSENSSTIFQIASLLPKNVSQCDGFGFQCVGQPSHTISTTARCNGVADCYDGSDEANCQTCQTAFSCPLRGNTSVLACLSPSALCDGKPHCANNEDENICNRKCTSDEISCGNRCIPKSMMCDGEVHCPDGQDEAKCEGKCRNGSKWCKSLKKCLPKDLLCNGRRNCPDGSDEENCDCKTCTGNGKRLCKREADIGFCLLSHQICDGNVDCPNGEDEDECLGHIHVEIPSSEMIKCKDGKKYSKAYACTGMIPACDGLCEKSAAPAGIRCKSDKKFLPAATRCDGRLDCEDGSDEENCSHEECAIHPFVMYGCDNQKRCFRVGEVCNPSSACPNATKKDKLYCAGRQAFPGHF